MGKIFDEIQTKLNTQNKNLSDITDEITRKKAIFNRKMGNYYKEKHSALMEIKDTLQKPIPVRVGDIIEELKKEYDLYLTDTFYNQLSIQRKGIIPKFILIDELDNKFNICGWISKENMPNFKYFSLRTTLPDSYTIQANGKTLIDQASTYYSEDENKKIPAHTTLIFSPEELSEIIVNVTYFDAQNATKENGPNFLDIIAKCEYDKDLNSTQEKNEDTVME